MFTPRPQPIPPQPGQESVWDYPRPPRFEKVNKRIQVVFNQVTIADTTGAYRLLETSHPPSYYLPPEDIQMEYLSLNSAQSYCEWKGTAGYYDLSVNGKVLSQVAWFYPEPNSPYEPLQNYVAFYAHELDGCYVDGEKVTPQPGKFYGGWITSDIVGPFKGEDGTWGW